VSSAPLALFLFGLLIAVAGTAAVLCLPAVRWRHHYVVVTRLGFGAAGLAALWPWRDPGAFGHLLVPLFCVAGLFAGAPAAIMACVAGAVMAAAVSPFFVAGGAVLLALESTSRGRAVWSMLPALAYVLLSSLPGSGGFFALTIMALALWSSSLRAGRHGSDSVAALAAGCGAIDLLLRGLDQIAAPPVWVGEGVATFGLFGLGFGALAALRARDAGQGLALLVRSWTGRVVFAAGAALVAKAQDLPTVAQVLVQSVLLAQVGSVFVWVAVSGALRLIVAGAGSSDLAALGGMARLMPRAGAIFGLGLVAASSLPPFVGFSSVWLMVQGVLAMPDASPLETGTAIGVLGVLAVALTLEAIAALRLGALVLLGRPRRPRSAGAADSARMAVALCASAVALGGGVLIAWMPGLVLRPFAAVVARLSDGDGLAAWASVRGPDGTQGFSPLVFGLLGCCVAAGLQVLRVRRPEAPAEIMMWQEGQEPPPPWLIFGEPGTQLGVGTLFDTTRSILRADVLFSRVIALRLRGTRGMAIFLRGADRCSAALRAWGGSVFLLVLACALAVLGWWPR